MAFKTVLYLSENGQAFIRLAIAQSYRAVTDSRIRGIKEAVVRFHIGNGIP
jgi:hypothetical protein